MSFLDKIKLSNKKVYILGGSGLIGSKVVINTLSVGAKVIIIDIKKNKYKRMLNMKNLIVQNQKL